MQGMQEFLAAATQVADPIVLLAIIAGSVVGIIFGSIPGLTFTMALALVLPLTFKMDTAAAVGMLLGTYIGGMTGGSVSAVLIGIPGTPSGTPASRMARMGAMPEASRMLEPGQCATPVPVRANRAMPGASSCTQCACQTSGPTQPRRSAYSAGVQLNFSRV